MEWGQTTSSALAGIRPLTNPKLPRALCVLGQCPNCEGAIQ